MPQTPGRHRKPRTSQTRRIVATASLGTAGIALPLIAASGASAATVSTWDKVAQCESGGDWSISTGNGFSGGLQFSASTWSVYGGTKYAPTADLATKAQQIAIAEQVLAEQGPEAWPVCGPEAGLGGGGAPAAVAPATSAPTTTPTTAPTGAPTAVRVVATPSTPATHSTPATSAPAATGTPRTTTAPSTAQSGTPGSAAAPSTVPHTGLPAGTPTHAGGTGSTGSTGTVGSSTGSSAAPTNGTAPGATSPGGTPAGAGATTGAGTGTGTGGSAPAPQAGPGEHTVVPGDTLSGIAAAAHLAGRWPALYQENLDTVGDNPDLILPGQQLTVG